MFHSDPRNLSIMSLAIIILSVLAASETATVLFYLRWVRTRRMAAFKDRAATDPIPPTWCRLPVGLFLVVTWMTTSILTLLLTRRS